MNNAPTVFAQIMSGLDATELARASARFPMPRVSKALRAYDHFAAMVFAQLTYRESLRGIEACLSSRPSLTYHMGIRGRVTRTNLAYANNQRDWRVFAEVAGSRLGSLSRTLTVLWTQQRCFWQDGHTCSNAGQKARAPSPAASLGETVRPRAFRSPGKPAQVPGLDRTSPLARSLGRHTARMGPNLSRTRLG